MTKFGLLITVENSASNTMNTVTVMYDNEYMAARAYNSITEKTKAAPHIVYHVVKLY